MYIYIYILLTLLYTEFWFVNSKVRKDALNHCVSLYFGNAGMGLPVDGFTLMQFLQLSN